MKYRFLVLFTGLITTCLFYSSSAQDIHPYKKKFSDSESWPSITPANISWQNFRPYRAVYNRTYTNMKKETVQDQVIMTAQRVAWYGKKAILFEYHDAASLAFEETNARTQFYYLDEKTLQMYLAVGPKAGTPEDYTTVRVLKDKITRSRVNTETGEVDFNELSTSEPSFGFQQLRFLMWAAMDLKVGNKIKLEPLYNAPRGTQSSALGIVEEQVDYTTSDNKKYRPYIVENASNMTSAIVNKFYIINEAPYLLAQGNYDADEDEIYRWWLKLEMFEYLDEK